MKSEVVDSPCLTTAISCHDPCSRFQSSRGLPPQSVRGDDTWIMLTTSIGTRSNGIAVPAVCFSSFVGVAVVSVVVWPCSFLTVAINLLHLRLCLSPQPPHRHLTRIGSSREPSSIPNRANSDPTWHVAMSRLAPCHTRCPIENHEVPLPQSRCLPSRAGLL